MNQVHEPLRPSQQAQGVDWPKPYLQSLDTAHAAVFLIDRHNGHIEFVSQKAKELLPQLRVGESVQRCTSEMKALLKLIEQALQSEDFNESFNGGEGDLRYCVHIDDGHLAAVSVVRDNAEPGLFEYMEARDNLFSTSRTISVSEMATTLAHELNTPIATIKNLLRGIQGRITKPDVNLTEIDAALSRALDQTTFTQNVISRIREFTQSRRPKQLRIDLIQQVRESVKLLDWLLLANRCQLALNLPDSEKFIQGDATMLQQVLINIIRNAVDAMQGQSVERRLVTINFEDKGSKYLLSIVDSGHGLAEGEDNLFIPFVTTKTTGMGVGLNICRSFVELHQGRLWLSPNDDEGCTCCIELPVEGSLQA
ncbi:MAG: sensor histidine kinase [Gammaproteobacteria bacterium]|nr:sensor histidine kinase [Gammaproteobacteria bacterium]